MDQNERIANRTVKGQTINMMALGINNGWISLNESYRVHIEFGLRNEYKPLIDTAKAESLTKVLEIKCLLQLDAYSNKGTVELCVGRTGHLKERFKKRLHL